MRAIIIIMFILWTTARHEASHALMAFLEGAELQEVKLLPGIHDELGFYFGYVIHSGDTTWLTEAAPYFMDVVILLLTTVILIRRNSRKYYREILLFGFISPIGDLIYNYQGGLWRNGTDVSDMLKLLPEWTVHLSFLLVISASILAFVYFRKKHSLLSHGSN